MIRLLIVDDSALIRRLLGDLFAAADDFEVAFARNGVEALERVRDFQPDVVTLDVHMPEMDGLTCLDQIMLERPCPVVMVSSLTEAGADVTLEALDLGAVDFIQKPEGAISLKMDELGPELVDKVRVAAGARLRRSRRLVERLRRRNGTAVAKPRPVRQPKVAPAPTHDEPDAPPSALPGLVLIGCSTGGPPALDAVLEELPGDFPWPVLVAQHMPSSFTGPLARRLDRLCALNVVEVTRPTLIVPGRVYIGKGDADLVVGMRPAGLMAVPMPTKAEYRWHPSVDRMVDSALAYLDPRQLVGVLMTGMGYDGAEAMTRLRQRGGRTVAEAEETAVVWGMPGELVRAGGAEFVVPVDGIAARMIKLVGGQ
ncbi:MAG: chemotaxis-specific protein-glutamate methyltransferase CheB [Azospirillaceae bacterium]|nr:chemotaxis-specific protein-glutamate methyltransferase CheB [Azospirillaceae bacterium]